MLDCRVRAGVPFAGVWRRRLALKAAAASARIARRGEDEATLRDVFFLRHGGDDPGPAGRMLVAWRGLDRSAPLCDESVFHVVETLQLKMDDALRAAIAEAQQLAASTQAAPFAAAQAARIVAPQPGAGILALWLADAVLAARLKWSRPLPLIAGALAHPSLRTGGHRPGDDDWTRTCCVAYGRGAIAACDLFAELGRSSQKLIAVAPRLRAPSPSAGSPDRPSLHLRERNSSMKNRKRADWVRWLGMEYSGQVSPPLDPASRMRALVANLTDAALNVGAHKARQLIGTFNGEETRQSVADWFAAGPLPLMGALANAANGLVVPGDAASSTFLTEVLANAPSMAAVIETVVIDGKSGRVIINEWINSGCGLPAEVPPSFEPARVEIASLRVAPVLRPGARITKLLARREALYQKQAFGPDAVH
jgi:hypothetical protein